jgi:hypothetical protein
MDAEMNVSEFSLRSSCLCGLIAAQKPLARREGMGCVGGEDLRQKNLETEKFLCLTVSLPDARARLDSYWLSKS